jgi:hypothetical protein
MSTDLWTLPIITKEQFATPTILPAFPGPIIYRHPALASFTHSIRTWMNLVEFAHQPLGDPWISTLLKAVRRGFLNGCPNMSKKMILKYLNLSPATAKGHMKRPCQGIQSTTPKNVVTPPAPSIEASPIQMLPPPLFVASCDLWGHWIEQQVVPHGPNLVINDNRDKTIANVFAFGAFTDKNSSIMYHNLTGLFPFVSLDGSVGFFVLYHYKLNSILMDPITGLDDKTIFDVYKKQFDNLTKRGFKVKLNEMDNQATKYIKHFLDKNNCKLQLIEPHNH